MCQMKAAERREREDDAAPTKARACSTGYNELCLGDVLAVCGQPLGLLIG